MRRGVGAAPCVPQELSGLYTSDEMAQADNGRVNLAAAGGGSSDTTSKPSTVNTGAKAPGGQPAAAEAVDVEVVEDADWRMLRVHFGRNRGLMLSELSPQQMAWYRDEWMPKKEVNGPTSVEDLALITALKAYSGWRAEQKQSPRGSAKGGQAAPRPATKPAPVVATEATPKPEDESQEQEETRDQFQRWMRASKITEAELDQYLRIKKFGRRAPLLGPVLLCGGHRQWMPIIKTAPFSSGHGEQVPAARNLGGRSMNGGWEGAQPFLQLTMSGGTSVCVCWHGLSSSLSYMAVMAPGSVANRPLVRWAHGARETRRRKYLSQEGGAEVPFSC